MLVLSRKIGERIVIGPNIVVTVVDVQGERVRLGFQAPQETPIHREEVLERLLQSDPDHHPRSHFGSPFFSECA